MTWPVHRRKHDETILTCVAGWILSVGSMTVNNIFGAKQPWFPVDFPSIQVFLIYFWLVDLFSSNTVPRTNRKNYFEPPTDNQLIPQSWFHPSISYEISQCWLVLNGHIISIYIYTLDNGQFFHCWILILKLFFHQNKKIFHQYENPSALQQKPCSFA